MRAPLLLPLLTVASIFLFIGKADSAERNGELIRRLCLAAFDSAMSHAGKTPPAGMGNFTCQCFMNRLDSGASIEMAQKVCRSEASQRYPI